MLWNSDTTVVYHYVNVKIYHLIINIEFLLRLKEPITHRLFYDEV